MVDLYLVTVDTGGKSSSDITGYHEHRCSEAYFKKHIVGHPDSTCCSSKVAKLCGLDVKLYFHKTERENSYSGGSSVMSQNKRTNRAATLLTLNPKTGSPKYQIKGVAYVVLDDGTSPLSLHQVWGIQELINYARDVYKSDSDDKARGKRELLKSCRMYRQQCWGPLSIYKPRSEESCSVVPPNVIKVKPKEREPFKTLQL